jgi:GxxExxY protein
MNENDIGTRVIEAAIGIHRELGQGQLETVYDLVLARELSDLGLFMEWQVSIPINDKGVRFDEGFRADIVVGKKVLLELKSVERIASAHKKQGQTYLKPNGLKLGYLLTLGKTFSRVESPDVCEWS